MLAVLDGALAMEVDEAAQTLTAGEACRIPAGVAHHVVRPAHAGVVRLLNLRLTAEDSLMAQEVASLPRQVVRVDPIEMMQLANSVGDHPDIPLPTLMAAVWRLVAAVREAGHVDHRQIVDQSLDPRLAVCETLIREMLDRARLDATLLADRVGLSRSQLDRLYRDRFDQSPTARIKQARIDQARRLLTASSYSVKQIAAVCGFGRTVNFTRAFRDAHGYTPSEFRDELRATATL